MQLPRQIDLQTHLQPHSLAIACLQFGAGCIHWLSPMIEKSCKILKWVCLGNLCSSRPESILLTKLPGSFWTSLSQNIPQIWRLKGSQMLTSSRESSGPRPNTLAAPQQAQGHEDRRSSWLFSSWEPGRQTKLSSSKPTTAPMKHQTPTKTYRALSSPGIPCVKSQRNTIRPSSTLLWFCCK